MFFSGRADWPKLTTTGVVFSALAGVAGAVGALCVIYATKSAVESAKASELNPNTYKIFIAPLIFGLAPVINTLVSMVWHPKAGQPFHFALELPGWKLWVGILLVGIGAALVLFSKEEAEGKKSAGKNEPAPAVAKAPDPTTNVQEGLP
jgi:drug/metabolite transporter (DMT)-like permease